MTKIYLIRHAEAEGNFYRRIQGHYDGDITVRGLAQINLLAERFRDINIDAVYASDLRRTQKTAQSILKYHNLPLHIEPRLKEVDMGSWEDVPWGNASYYDPEQMLLFSNDPESWNIPGSEDFKDLQKRITGIILELAARHSGQTIACFSHGMAIRTLIAGAKGVPSDQIHEIQHGDNTCVALLNVENSHIDIEYYNDNSHLTSDVSTFAGQSWWKTKSAMDFANLRFEPMNVKEEAKLYNSCYKDGWQEAHGTLSGYSEGPYLKCAQRVSTKDPQTLMKVFSGDTFAGIIELDPERLASDGAGWVSFIYLTPEMRGQGYAVQLMGHAISYYRKKGRQVIRLHVAETNKKALSFYDKLQFKRIGEEDGNSCRLLLLEKEI